MRRLLLLLLLVVPALHAQAPSTPEALARAFQDRLRGVRDFSADFSQITRSGPLRRQSTWTGTVKIKRPGRMRWIYLKPERQEFVSDGTKFYSYVPAEKLVSETSVPSDDQATTPMQFLAGEGDVARDFTAAFVESPVPGAFALKLTPRKTEPDYEYFIVGIDPGTLRILTLTTRDRQGGDVTLTFSKLKENQGLSDNEFVFRIPRGVKVVTDDARK